MGVKVVHLKYCISRRCVRLNEKLKANHIILYVFGSSQFDDHTCSRSSQLGEHPNPNPCGIRSFEDMWRCLFLNICNDMSRKEETEVRF